mgnify:CR=1 FL=1
MAQTPKKVSDLYVNEKKDNFLRPQYMSATSTPGTPGEHFVQVFWAVSAGTGANIQNDDALTVKELSQQ